MDCLDVKILKSIFEEASINLQPFKTENVLVFKLHPTGESGMDILRNTMRAMKKDCWNVLSCPIDLQEKQLCSFSFVVFYS